MEQKEILEGNVKIAKFMGWDEENDKYPTNVPGEIWGKFFDNKILYHSDWRWLMPVVEKIAKHYDVRITWMPNALDVTYIYRPDVYEGEITSMGGLSAFENTWYCVVRFIDWYNLNVTTNPIEDNNKIDI
jgi:hypothetical protein